MDTTLVPLGTAAGNKARRESLFAQLVKPHPQRPTADELQGGSPTRAESSSSMTLHNQDDVASAGCWKESASPPSSSQRAIGDFIIKASLGKGAFSIMCLAEHKTTKQKVSAAATWAGCRRVADTHTSRLR